MHDGTRLLQDGLDERESADLPADSAQVRAHVAALLAAARTLCDACADLADALRPLPGNGMDDPLTMDFARLRAEQSAALLDEASAAARGTYGLLKGAYTALDAGLDQPPLEAFASIAEPAGPTDPAPPELPALAGFERDGFETAPAFDMPRLRPTITGFPPPGFDTDGPFDLDAAVEHSQPIAPPETTETIEAADVDWALPEPPADVAWIVPPPPAPETTLNGNGALPLGDPGYRAAAELEWTVPPPADPMPLDAPASEPVTAAFWDEAMEVLAPPDDAEPAAAQPAAAQPGEPEPASAELPEPETDEADETDETDEPGPPLPPSPRDSTWPEAFVERRPWGGAAGGHAAESTGRHSPPALSVVPEISVTPLLDDPDLAGDRQAGLAALARQVEAARRHLQSAVLVAHVADGHPRLDGLLGAVEQVLAAVTELAQESRETLADDVAARTFPGEARFLCAMPWERTPIVATDPYGPEQATSSGLARLLAALGYDAQAVTSTSGVIGVQVRSDRCSAHVALVEPAGGGRQRWSGALEWTDLSGASRTWAETLGPIELDEQELAHRVDDLLRRYVGPV